MTAPILKSKAPRRFTEAGKPVGWIVPMPECPADTGRFIVYQTTEAKFVVRDPALPFGDQVVERKTFKSLEQAYDFAKVYAAADPRELADVSAPKGELQLVKGAA